ncbi:MAG: DNA mismatch repair protein MutS [Lachnospirales bacterium]
MPKLTPMMNQYMEIKEKYKDMFLFYRLGDFYELFFEDAKEASRILDLTLTGKSCGQTERAPMCGVPYHSAQGYITKLIEMGHKVAICEQVEDAKEAKGLVKREVVRVITPGTITDTDEKNNNYIMSIFENKSGLGFGICDVATGDFYVSSFLNGTKKDLTNEIGKFSPKEIIVNAAFSKKEEIEKMFNISPYTYSDWAFNYKTSEKTLINHFNIFNLRVYDMDDNVLEISATGALLNYLKETQKNSLNHITKIKRSHDENHMILDLSSRKNLELTESVNGKNKKNSLFWVLNKTLTPSGSRLMRTFVETPLINKNKIEERLNGVSAIKENYILKEDLKQLLAHVKDVERILGRIIYRTVNGRDLVALKNSIFVFPEIKEILKDIDVPIIKKIYNNLDNLEDISTLITSSINEDPPFSIREGNIIANGYNKDLDDLRTIKNDGTGWLIKIENEEKEKTGIKNLKIKYNKIFGYYLEVTKSYLNLVPDRYIRKQTLANAERYITEDLKVVEEKILNADSKIVDIEYAIFMNIVFQLEEKIPRIQQSMESISYLDVLLSLAQVAESNNYVKPEINTQGIIEIEDGRHPVVEKIADEFIENTTSLHYENRLSIVTGPNMSGKSTYMRQVALITLMAQVGSYIPAKKGNIGIVDRIFTRVGASDDLATGQSTFMVEMNEVANILINATENSLLILDEIGRGTSTFDGLSIAWAILEYIAKEKKSKTLFATHYHELSDLEGKLDGVKNYCINVEKKGEDIIFLRKIKEGSIDHSYGIHVAKLAGIPKELISRSKNILHVLESTSNKTEIELEKDQVYYNEENEFKELIDEIKSADINNLTPIDALNLVYKLKEMI